MHGRGVFALQALADELGGYPAPPDDNGVHPTAEVYVPLRIRSPAGVLNLISIITVFGTPVDITLSELALESFYPADTATGERLRALAGLG